MDDLDALLGKGGAKFFDGPLDYGRGTGDAFGIDDDADLAGGEGEGWIGSGDEGGGSGEFEEVAAVQA